MCSGGPSQAASADIKDAVSIGYQYEVVAPGVNCWVVGPDTGPITEGLPDYLGLFSRCQPWKFCKATRHCMKLTRHLVTASCRMFLGILRSLQTHLGPMV